MEQIATEQTVKFARSLVVPIGAVQGIIGNQTYISPLTEKVMVALEGLRPYVAAESSDSDEDGFELCRSRMLDVDLYDSKLGGDVIFGNRSGPLFQGARKMYLNALANELVEIRAQFESGERTAQVTPLEMTWLCTSTINDLLIGPKVKVIFDSSLAYAEPNNADVIDRAERRYHGVKRD